MCHTITYQYYTKLMIQSLISYVLNWLNAFSTKGGISKTTSPYLIIKGKINTDFNKDRFVFGSYTLVYTGTSSNMTRPSMSSIALKKSNHYGGHYFMSLYTENISHRYEHKFHRKSKAAIYR